MFPWPYGAPRKIPSYPAIREAWAAAKARDPRLTKTAFAKAHGITYRHLANILRFNTKEDREKRAMATAPEARALPPDVQAMLEEQPKPKRKGSGFTFSW